MSEQSTVQDELESAVLSVLNAYGDFQEHAHDKIMYWVVLGEMLGNLERAYKNLEYAKLPSGKTNE